MKYPKWCSQIISPAEIEQVADAITNAEKKTTGEIVSMIVGRSSSVGQLGFQIFTIFCLLDLLVFMFLEKLGIAEEPLWIVLGIMLISWPISDWASKRMAIQRLFTVPQERERQVHTRATLEFYASGFQNTKQNTGILIFLSLMERKCVVLADKGIATKLPPETWQGIVDKIINGIRENQTSSGLIGAIEECGRILSQHFPSPVKGDNQLENHLIIKD